MTQKRGENMLDIKKIREDFDGVKAGVERRCKGDFGIDRVKELDAKRREVLAEVEALKNKQNVTSREVPKLKKAGEDTTALFAEMKQLSARIKELDGEVSSIEEELRTVLLGIPNVPRLIGTSAKASTSSTSRERAKSPAPVSPYTRDWAQSSKEPSSTSCSTCTQKSRDTQRFCLRSWSTETP